MDAQITQLNNRVEQLLLQLEQPNQPEAIRIQLLTRIMALNQRITQIRFTTQQQQITTLQQQLKTQEDILVSVKELLLKLHKKVRIVF